MKKFYSFRIDQLLLFFLLTLPSGCYVNRAVVDYEEYSQPNPYTYWTYPSKLHVSSQIDPSFMEGVEEPLSVGELIDIALKHSPQTRSTWAQARLAGAQYAQSQSLGFPEANGQFNWTRFRTITVIGPPNDATSALLVPYFLSVWGPQLSLSYLIFDFGTQRATSQAARFALYFANWTQNWSIQSLVNTITSDYYNYAYQEQLLAAFEEDLYTANVTLNAAKESLARGVEPVSDVLQAETQYLQTKLNLIAQRQQVTNAYTKLLADAGIPANLKLPTMKLPYPTPSIEFLKEIGEFVSQALESRSDLLAAKAQVKQAWENVKVAKRQRLPQLNAAFDLGKTYYSGGFNDGYDFNLTFSLTFPLFKGFYYRNAIKAAQENQRIAEANLNSVALQVIEQVVSAHQQVKVAFDSLDSAKAFLKAAAEQYRVSLGQYRAGVSSILDVVSAQSALANARATEAQTRQEWFTALASLAYSTGSLMDPAILQQEAKVP